MLTAAGGFISQVLLLPFNWILLYTHHTHTHTHTRLHAQNNHAWGESDDNFTNWQAIHYQCWHTQNCIYLDCKHTQKNHAQIWFFFSIYVFPKERRQMGQITWSSMRMIWKPGTSATQGEWKPPVIRPGYYPRHCTLMKTYQLTIDFQIQYSAPLPGCDRNLLPVQYWSPSPQPAPSVTNVGRLATRNQCQQPVMLPLDAQM